MKNLSISALNPEASFSSPLWILAVISISVIYPRFVLLGNFPYIDEGSYAILSALCAKSLAAGVPLPVMHGLPMQSALFAWTALLPGMQLWLRLGDLAIACVAAWFLCRIFQKESQSPVMGLVLGIIFLCPMNYVNVIDAGFKNSIPIASSFLFAAFYIIQSAPHPKKSIFFASGVLTCLAVLFREPFLVFAILGFFSIMLGYDFKRSIIYAMGGICVAIMAFSLILWYQGGISGLVEIAQGYVGRGILYSQENYRIAHNFISALDKSARFFVGPFIISIGAILGLFFMYRAKDSKFVLSKRALFWLAAICAPLVEATTKIAFLYHLAICLPPLGGFCAYCFRQIYHNLANITNLIPGYKTYSRCLVCLCCILSLWGLPSPVEATRTFAMFRHFPQDGWPEELTNQSNTLLAAKEIKRILPKGGSLGTSALTSFLYEATRALPPNPTQSMQPGQYGMMDMSRTWQLLGKNKERFIAALKASPPDVLAIAKAYDAHEKDYAEELREVIGQTGMYELVKIIPANPQLNYGWLEYYIYSKKGLPRLEKGL